MKLLFVSVAGLALIASPVLAQQDNTTDQQSTTTTHVKSTTRHVHATNVPRSTHHATHHMKRMHHHAMRCGCPSGHMKAHHVKHVVKKTTTTSTSSSS